MLGRTALPGLLPFCRAGGPSTPARRLVGGMRGDRPAAAFGEYPRSRPAQYACKADLRGASGADATFITAGTDIADSLHDMIVAVEHKRRESRHQ